MVAPGRFWQGTACGNHRNEVGHGHETTRRNRRRAPNGWPARHQGGEPAGRGLLARRAGLRNRGPLPAHGIPAARGDGRGRPRDLPLAPRAVRSRVRLHPRPVGRRRQGLRRRDRRRRRVRARPPRRRRGGALATPAPRRPRRRPRARDREVGARAARVRCATRRDRAHRPRLRHHVPRRGMERGPHRARRDGERDRRARGARTGRRADPRARVRRSRHRVAATALPGRSPVDGRRARRAPLAVVPTLHRHALERRRRARARHRTRGRQ